MEGEVGEHTIWDDQWKEKWGEDCLGWPMEDVGGYCLVWPIECEEEHIWADQWKEK